MPAPLIEFAKFAEPASWLLRRGRPPWLNDPRWYANALRATLVLGCMGTLTGWLAFAGMMTIHVLETYSGTRFTWWLEFFTICGPGLWFALGLLIPLSRWLGRGWIMTALAIPASTIACYYGALTLFFVSPIMGTSPTWIPGGREAAMFYSCFVGAALVSIWMGHPGKVSAWSAGITASLLAGIGCHAVGMALERNSFSTALLPAKVADGLPMLVLFSSFQTLTAIGLGARLWDPEKAQTLPSPGDA